MIINKNLFCLIITHFLSTSFTTTNAFNVQPKQKVALANNPTIYEKATKMIHHAFSISLITGTLILGSPQSALSVSDDVSGPLETAILDASRATYPILKSLSPTTITPIANKVATIVTKKIPSEKLTKAVDGTADTILAIPDDKLDTFLNSVKSSYQDISLDTCNTVPFPAAAASIISSSEGITNINSEKLTLVTDKVLTPLSQTIPYDTNRGVICLPPNSKEGLQQIWVSQTKLFLSIPTPIKQQLASDISPALKSIPSTELLRILPDVKKVLAGVDRKEAFQFQETSKVLDKALKQDYRLKSISLF